MGDLKYRLLLASSLVKRCDKFGKYFEGVKLKQLIYEIKCKLYGDEDKETVEILNDLAYSYRCLADYKKELKILEKTYSICCGIYGENSKNTLSILQDIACAYTNLVEKCVSLAEEGKMDEAVNTYISIYKKLEAEYL